MTASTKINIPESDQERVVIVGGGFAGLQMARKLAKSNYQIVLIDKNNYHQFQPLFYQVAMAGLEPSSIVFPFRKIFHNRENVFIRVTEVTEVKVAEKRLETPLGFCNYDHLIVATGAGTNFFGNENLERHALPMKSVGEALFLRNHILEDYETSLSTPDYDNRQELVDIVIVGGGPTGVELAGSLAEMRRYVLPKDYPELDVEKEVDIYLVQAGPTLLKGMSEKSGEKALKYLEKLGVRVLLNTRVTDFDGKVVTMKDGSQIPTTKVIWAAGIKGQPLHGIPADSITYGNRLAVDRQNRIKGMQDIYAIGDVAYMEEPDFPQGHPQVAQVAIQMGANVAKNFQRRLKNKPTRDFSYRDKGSMATVGRAKAVVDLPNFHFGGLMAWLAWLVVHLFAILGTKNKLFVFINWLINYLNYSQSLRLIIRAEGGEKAKLQE
ncbi:MAG: NAD(P)/FAD-dependent oxidoreductase [Bacteroidota bacterium]